MCHLQMLSVRSSAKFFCLEKTEDSSLTSRGETIQQKVYCNTADPYCNTRCNMLCMTTCISDHLYSSIWSRSDREN